MYRSQGFFTISTTCPTCRGAGQVIKKPCKPCKGSGHIVRKKHLKVKIPAGVDTGATMRVPGEGELGELGGPPGDLYVVIAIRPHETFIRQGDDLYLEVSISFVQAALGTILKVPTLDGETDLEIKAGTQPDEIYSLKNKGIKHLRGGGQGSMHVGIKVEIPKNSPGSRKNSCASSPRRAGKTSRTPKERNSSVNSDQSLLSLITLPGSVRSRSSLLLNSSVGFTPAFSSIFSA